MGSIQSNYQPQPHPQSPQLLLECRPTQPLDEWGVLFAFHIKPLKLCCLLLLLHSSKKRFLPLFFSLLIQSAAAATCLLDGLFCIHIAFLFFSSFFILFIYRTVVLGSYQPSGTLLPPVFCFFTILYV